MGRGDPLHIVFSNSQLALGAIGRDCRDDNYYIPFRTSLLIHLERTVSKVISQLISSYSCHCSYQDKTQTVMLRGSLETDPVASLVHKLGILFTFYLPRTSLMSSK